LIPADGIGRDGDGHSPGIEGPRSYPAKL
jgi:hypothetical protein